ncbi:RHS repeat-associated core domain-containing protein [Cupriavidus malaysiensis]|uniref:RHS repeat-associated core domain-containing protein n=1 Tax=Cupriavidus malaysiensis TaxID=367825 RepID=UPI00196A73BF
MSRFGYTGQQYLAPLGSYYYKAQMYSPTLGRFLQADLIGYPHAVTQCLKLPTPESAAPRVRPDSIRVWACAGHGSQDEGSKAGT